MRVSIKRKIFSIVLLPLLFIVFNAPQSSLAQTTSPPVVKEDATPTATNTTAPAAEDTADDAPIEETAAEEKSGDVKQQGVPLIIDGEKLFDIKIKLGPYTAQKRVLSIEKRIKTLEDNPQFDSASITTLEDNYGTDIVSGSTVLLTVTDLDAKAAGVKSRQELAKLYAEKLKGALKKDVEEHSLPKFMLSVAFAAATTLALLIVLGLTSRVFHWLYKKLHSWEDKRIRSLKIQQAVLLDSRTFTEVLIGIARLMRLIAVVIFLVAYSTITLGFFPVTRPLSKEIAGTLLYPLTNVVLPQLIAYLPNIGFITVITIGTYYFNSFIRFLFNEVGRKNIHVPGFDADWADPTYKIARFLLIAFALVLIFPYLPGAGSPAFQQVSLFLGLLVSLGSSGAISHVIAGVFLTYTSAFKIGDRVKIADTVGDVVEKTLLATRIRTIKQEYITIPNGMVLNSHIINYSSSAADPGLILHTTVTIGYDAPWETVEKLLIDAALATKSILAEPKPFVLQTSLDDFFVSYEINAYTENPHQMAVTYSALHRNIQDKFNEAGVEIMSPHYSALRDGNTVSTPQSYRNQNYVAPGFGVFMQNGNDTQKKLGKD